MTIRRLLAGAWLAGAFAGKWLAIAVAVVLIAAVVGIFGYALYVQPGFGWAIVNMILIVAGMVVGVLVLTVALGIGAEIHEWAKDTWREGREP